MLNIISLIVANKEFVAILVSFLSLGIPLWQYLNTKRTEQEQENFRNFHNELLRTITGRGRDMGIEEQVAAIFELRNFPKYFSVTKRMLIDRKSDLEGGLQQNPQYSRLIREIDETTGYVNKNFLGRFFERVRNHL